MSENNNPSTGDTTQTQQPPAQEQTKMPGTMSLNDPALNQKPQEQFTIDKIVNNDGTFKEGWTSSVEGGESLSKYNNINDLIKGFVNANKLIGKKQEQISRPGADATDEQRKAWREHLGVPEKADDYQVPDEYKETVDAESFKEFAHFAHEHNIPADTMQELLRFQERYAAKLNEVNAKRIEEQAKEARKYFQAEWGGLYERNFNLLKDGLVRAGIDIESPEMSGALNNPFILSALFDKISSMQDGTMPVPGFMKSSASDAKEQIMGLINKYGSVNQMPHDARELYHRLLANKNIKW
jgi:hypothetical protein